MLNCVNFKSQYWKSFRIFLINVEIQSNAFVKSKKCYIQTSEWRRRRSRFAWWVCRTRRLARRLAAARNQELHAELQPYVWELCAVLALLDGFLRWLGILTFHSCLTSVIKLYIWRLLEPCQIDCQLNHNTLFYSTNTVKCLFISGNT